MGKLFVVVSALVLWVAVASVKPVPEPRVRVGTDYGAPVHVTADDARRLRILSLHPRTHKIVEAHAYLETGHDEFRGSAEGLRFEPDAVLDGARLEVTTMNFRGEHQTAHVTVRVELAIPPEPLPLVALRNLAVGAAVGASFLGLREQISRRRAERERLPRMAVS